MQLMTVTKKDRPKMPSNEGVQRFLRTPYGSLSVTACDLGVSGVDWIDAQTNQEVAVGRSGAASDWADQAVEELTQYFAGLRDTFTVPVVLFGTAFQTAVWQALTQIPYGETRSYRDIAQRIGSDKAVRAVGQANRNNPVAVIVPCHRVIGSSGALVGYAGSNVTLKAELIGLEQRRLSTE